MKKIIIGCLLTAIGTFSNVAMIISISFHINSLSSWETPPGKLSYAMQNTGASILRFPIILATICLILGLWFLFVGEENQYKG